jgi:hypothetical protein
MVLREVLMAHAHNVMPRSGGLYDQDWDFVYWLTVYHNLISEHQALMAKLNSR